MTADWSATGLLRRMLAVHTHTAFVLGPSQGLRSLVTRSRAGSCPCASANWLQPAGLADSTCCPAGSVTDSTTRLFVTLVFSARASVLLCADEPAPCQANVVSKCRMSTHQRPQPQHVKRSKTLASDASVAAEASFHLSGSCCTPV